MWKTQAACTWSTHLVGSAYNGITAQASWCCSTALFIMRLYPLEASVVRTQIYTHTEQLWLHQHQPHLSKCQLSTPTGLMSKQQHHFESLWDMTISDVESHLFSHTRHLTPHTHTYTKHLSALYARLLWWEPRRWPEAAQRHRGQRGGRHGALPAGLESPNHRRNRTHAQSRRQLHHRGLLHLSLHAPPENLHAVPQQGSYSVHKPLYWSHFTNQACLSLAGSRWGENESTTILTIVLLFRPFKQKCWTFSGSCFRNVRIVGLSLFYIIVNLIFLDF